MTKSVLIVIENGEQLDLEKHVPRERLADALSKLASSILTQPKPNEDKSA